MSDETLFWTASKYLMYAVTATFSTPLAICMLLADIAIEVYVNFW